MYTFQQLQDSPKNRLHLKRDLRLSVIQKSEYAEKSLRKSFPVTKSVGS